MDDPGDQEAVREIYPSPAICQTVWFYRIWALGFLGSVLGTKGHQTGKEASFGLCVCVCVCTLIGSSHHLQTNTGNSFSTNVKS